MLPLICRLDAVSGGQILIDARLRVEIRSWICSLDKRLGITIVHVTRDQSVVYEGKVFLIHLHTAAGTSQVVPDPGGRFPEEGALITVGRDRAASTAAEAWQRRRKVPTACSAFTRKSLRTWP